MTQEQFAQKMQEILTSSELKEKLNSGAGQEEVAEIFKAKGIDIPADSLGEVFAEMIKTVEKDELNENDLENVAGGVKLKDILKWGRDAINFANDCKPDGKYGSTIQKGFDAVYKFGFKRGWWR